MLKKGELIGEKEVYYNDIEMENLIEEIKQQAFYIQPEDNDIIYVRASKIEQLISEKLGQNDGVVMPENLRAMERLTAKQALEIDDLKIKLADDEEIIKDVRRKLINVGAPLNGNRERYTEEQLRIFFEIQQILSV